MSIAINSKAALALALTLTLTACGGSDEVATVDDQTLVATVEETPQASGGFDAPVVTPDKVSYTLIACQLQTRKICLRNVARTN